MATRKSKKLPATDALQLEQVPLAELKPYERNARMHSAEQVRQIAESIKAFGFNAPVLIDGSNRIVAGHGRVQAARLLELEQVPCIRLAHLSDAQRRAYILADNRIALSSTWDEALLALELADLKIDDIDLGLTGFSQAEIDALLTVDDAQVERSIKPTGKQEIDIESINTNHKCPKCGFEFDKSVSDE